MGLTAGMQGWFSIQKSINVIKHFNKMKKNHMVLSVNVKKIWQKLTPVYDF